MTRGKWVCEKLPLVCLADPTILDAWPVTRPAMNRKAERNVQFDPRGLAAGLVTLIEVKT